MTVVECDYVQRPDGYDMLGAFSGNGENSFDMPMPKTCPCVMSPCLEPQKTMFYVLPHPHTPLDSSAAPAPPPAPSERLLGRGVRTRVVEGLTVGVVKFSGYATPDVVFSARDELKAAMKRDGVPFDDSEDNDNRVMIAQYNELYSLPWNRDNEVWLPVEPW